MHDILEGVPVSRIMRQDPPVISPDMYVSSLVHNRVIGTDDHAFPVMEGNRLVGIVCLHDIRRVNRGEWDTTRVRDIMTPADQLVVVSPDDESANAMNRLSNQDLNQLPVVKDGQLVGLIRRRDLMRWLQLHSEGSRA